MEKQFIEIRLNDRYLLHYRWAYKGHYEVQIGDVIDLVLYSLVIVDKETLDKLKKGDISYIEQWPFYIARCL